MEWNNTKSTGPASESLWKTAPERSIFPHQLTPARLGLVVVTGSKLKRTNTWHRESMARDLLSISAVRVDPVAITLFGRPNTFNTNCSSGSEGPAHASANWPLT